MPSDKGDSLLQVQESKYCFMEMELDNGDT
jgi:hypothetical protein